VTAIGVGLIERKSLPMTEEVLNIADRNRESQVVSHVSPSAPAGHADHLTPLVKQRPSRIARVDRRVRLKVKLTLKIATAAADDSLGHRPFQPQRVAHRED